MLESRDLWGTAPPEPRSRMNNWPTVLFSWWCTSSAAAIIITRVLGRKVRSVRLFREDWIMLLSLMPLFIRMIAIHFVLIYGTNNVDTTNFTYTEVQLHHRSIGSRLVLCARIFYAMFIWFNKLSVWEFLNRITNKAWRRSWELTLQGIRIFLFVTFGAVVIATLTECQPFRHYWQVIPDPGAHCRQGFAQLLTMGTCDIITDILLIAFPIPVVLKSGQSWNRKLQMGALFSLSIVMIIVTATRMPEVISHRGRQQYRTVWASCEILASAAVSNGVILGSFLRDKGTKRNKYRNYSISDSIERTSTRRPTIAGILPGASDEDLFRSVGCRIPSHLQDHAVSSTRLAPPVAPAPSSHRSSSHYPDLPPIDTQATVSGSDERPVLHHGVLPSPASSTTPSASFFDVGHLLEDEASSSHTRQPWAEPKFSAPETHDFAERAAPSSESSHFGSSAFLRDIGGLLHEARSPRLPHRRPHDHSGTTHEVSTVHRHISLRRQQKAPVGPVGPTLERQETELSLQDVGGLLGSSAGPAPVSNGHYTGEESGGLGSPSRSPQPSSSRRHSHQDDIELEDIGGLLSDKSGLSDRPAISPQGVPQRDRDQTT